MEEIATLEKTKKIVVKNEEFNLEEKDYCLIETLRELTSALRNLGDRLR
jgi:hypothetical protein